MGKDDKTSKKHKKSSEYLNKSQKKETMLQDRTFDSSFSNFNHHKNHTEKSKTMNSFNEKQQNKKNRNENENSIRRQEMSEKDQSNAEVESAHLKNIIDSKKQSFTENTLDFFAGSNSNSQYSFNELDKIFAKWNNLSDNDLVYLFTHENYNYPLYKLEYLYSTRYFERYYASHARSLLHFFKPFERVFNQKVTSPEWFSDGLLNACYNCLDRNYLHNKDKIGLICESNDMVHRYFTYEDGLKFVNKICCFLMQIVDRNGLDHKISKFFKDFNKIMNEKTQKESRNSESGNNILNPASISAVNSDKKLGSQKEIQNFGRDNDIVNSPSISVVNSAQSLSKKESNFEFIDSSEFYQKHPEFLEDTVPTNFCVAIYMPMCAEAVFSALACSRLGIPHNVIFGGFNAESLAMRLKDSNAKILITVDYSFREKKKIDFLKNVEVALAILSKENYFLNSVLVFDTEECLRTFYVDLFYWSDVQKGFLANKSSKVIKVSENVDLKVKCANVKIEPQTNLQICTNLEIAQKNMNDPKFSFESELKAEKSNETQPKQDIHSRLCLNQNDNPRSGLDFSHKDEEFSVKPSIYDEPNHKKEERRLRTINLVHKIEEPFEECLDIEGNKQNLSVSNTTSFDINQFIPCRPVSSENPLFILYTSGSTGKPKGLVHTTAGYILYALITTKKVFNIKKDDIYMCTADLGWITGHTYAVYGPLLNNITTVLVGGNLLYPSEFRVFESVCKLKVTVLYTAPTAIRLLQRAIGEKVGNKKPQRRVENTSCVKKRKSKASNISPQTNCDDLKHFEENDSCKILTHNSPIEVKNNEGESNLLINSSIENSDSLIKQKFDEEIPSSPFRKKNNTQIEEKTGIQGKLAADELSKANPRTQSKKESTSQKNSHHNQMNEDLEFSQLNEDLEFSQILDPFLKTSKEQLCYYKKSEHKNHGYNLSSLRILGSVGEPINKEAYIWFKKHFGPNLMLVDTYWQTEAGGILLSPIPYAMKPIPECAGMPFFGLTPKIVRLEEDKRDSNVEKSFNFIENGEISGHKNKMRTETHVSDDCLNQKNSIDFENTIIAQESSLSDLESLQVEFKNIASSLGSRGNHTNEESNYGKTLSDASLSSKEGSVFSYNSFLEPKDSNLSTALGTLVFTSPWPGIARTILNDHSRYEQYFKNNYYITGDESIQKNGLFQIKGRLDDIINVSGHRLSTQEIESAVCSNKKINECAVIGSFDEISGQRIVVFVKVKKCEESERIEAKISERLFKHKTNINNSMDYSHQKTPQHHFNNSINSDSQNETLLSEKVDHDLNMFYNSVSTSIRQTLRDRIGPVVNPKSIFILKDLPKTRTGKIMRRILRKIVENDNDLGDLSTCANLESIEYAKYIILTHNSGLQ